MPKKPFTPNEKLTRLGASLRQERKNRKLTQEKLFDLTGVAIRTISKIERGLMNPSYLILSALVEKLDVSLDSMIRPADTQDEADLREIRNLYMSCPKSKRRMVLAAIRSFVTEMAKDETEL